jgi:adenylosuccinate lyase
MKARAAFDLKRCKELERTLNHDVIAFIPTWPKTSAIQPPLAPFRLTSSDVVDTAFAVQMVSRRTF